ncbi:PE family protein [Mycobacterium sp. 852002-51057_SCH5723018]|uniref:PE family protein n=1 Tax=Mycobacterium sp. 852002-51057_SCH5723018 TaxID=1834094 RepID=UPI0008015AB7|nr:PE family protein [Mycobacterium sp. 852002-51057_SCH5723018]OBG27878.1 PE family protein [Mycobacterium sp. 852002-51057_SCH5723018]
MSFLFAAPDGLVAAASDLAGVGSTLSAANEAVAAPTAAVAAAAADQVSAQVAAFFSEHGLDYQQLSAQVSAFHERFVQALSAGAGTYAAAEADAAQTLTSAVNAPAAAVLGNPALGGGGGAAGAVSGAVNRIESAVLGSSLPGVAGAQAIAGQAGALLLRPTGAISALTAARALLAPSAMTNAGAMPAALASAAFGDTIKNSYTYFEPYVRYGFELAQYAVGYLPYVGFLAPQVLFFYDLIEPMVQSGLFNLLDWLGGSITFVQGLNNFFTATAASINQFINTEINWALGFLPPLPPLPPIFP